MTNSIKMTKLDFMSLKSQHVFFIAALLMIFFGFMNSSFMVMCITAAWYSALISTSIFAVQEKNDMNRLYSSLPISQTNIVLGRYIFMFSVYAISLIIGIASYFIFHNGKNRPLELSEFIVGIGISLFISSVIIGIQTPLFFKLGYTKARLYSMIPFALTIILTTIPALVKSLIFIFDFLQGNQIILSISGVIAGAIILFCSYKISVIAYRKHK